LNNPGNLASQVKYAAGAKDDPDIENAISAYDRLLFYNPALARVRFELGVLYARLGSYQQARAYFE
jgi:tetratricopeptide (TPR) repeat protein